MYIYDVEGVKEVKYETDIRLREILMRGETSTGLRTALEREEIFSQSSLFVGF
jgi:hypothetical protein